MQGASQPSAARVVTSAPRPSDTRTDRLADRSAGGARVQRSGGRLSPSSPRRLWARAASPLGAVGRRRRLDHARRRRRGGGRGGLQELRISRRSDGATRESAPLLCRPRLSGHRASRRLYPPSRKRPGPGGRPRGPWSIAQRITLMPLPLMVAGPERDREAHCSGPDWPC